MAVSNTIFRNLFGGHNVQSESVKTGRRAFNIPDEIIVVDAIIKEIKPYNPEQREGFFAQRGNSAFSDFSKSAPFSQAATATIAQASVPNGAWVPDRLSGNNFRSGPFSSFNSPNKTAQLVIPLANI